jgi:chromosomal replication initiation ATPase DnaA
MNYYTKNPDTLTIGAFNAPSLLQEKPKVEPRTLPEAIVMAVAEYYETDIETLRQHGRDEPRATHRLTAAYMAKKVTSISNEDLARLLRRHNQSTISKMMSSVERKVESGKISQEDVVRLNVIIGELVKNWNSCHA